MMRKPLKILWCVTFCLALPLLAAAQDIPGLKIGEKAPDFKLKSQFRKEVSLSETLKKGPAAIVFYRSASW